MSFRAAIEATRYLFGDELTVWRWPTKAEAPNAYRAAFDAYQAGYKAGYMNKANSRLPRTKR